MRKLTDYGFVILAHMARGEVGEVHTTAALSTATRVPAPTTAKILKRLVRTGVLDSRRGLNGGYLLARPSAHISITEVVEALEGPIAITECATVGSHCDDADHCDLAGHWPLINLTVRKALLGVSLAELCSPRPRPSGTESCFCHTVADTVPPDAVSPDTGSADLATPRTP